MLEPIVEASDQLSKDKHANYVVQCIWEGMIMGYDGIFMGKLWDKMMGDGWENDGRSEGRVLFKKRA